VFSSLIVKLAALALIIFTLVYTITKESEFEKQEKELAQINAKIEYYEAANFELMRVIDDPDVSSYMEKTALENQGYAYPDEIRFYDTSRY